MILLLIFSLFNLLNSQNIDDEQWSLGPTFGFGRSSQHKHTNPTSRTVNDLRNRASEGNPEAQYFLGLLMWYGDGVGVNREGAMDLFRKAAKQGHIHAQFNVGLILAFSAPDPTAGGIDHDMTSAFKWVANAASEGLSDANWLLGLMYRDAKGTEKNYEKAFEHFQLAADQHSARGYFFVGMMHEYGLGTPTSFKDAAKNYRRAAAQQDSRAIYYLGLMHAYGRGMEQDFQQALILFKEAAELGQVGAQIYLGKMYLHGHGVGVNYDLAYHWFEVASASEDPRSKEAERARDELGQLLKGARDNIQRTLDEFKIQL
jgi:uncharacterized protein